MARVSLKNSIIRFVDGYSKTSAVNDTPANLDSTLTIDGLAADTIIPLSTRFTVVGNSRRHFVTAQSANAKYVVTVDATSGNFTITFKGTFASPVTQVTSNIAEGATAAAVQAALEAVAGLVPGDVSVTGSAGGPWTIEFMGTYADTKMTLPLVTDVSLMGGGDTVGIVATYAGGTTHDITFEPAIRTVDGVPVDDAVITFAGRTLEIKVGDGNLTYEEKREIEYVRDRGALDDVQEGDEQPVEVSLSMVWEELRALAGSDTPTPEEVLKNTGAASDWESSDSDPCKLYAIDIEVETNKAGCASGFQEVVVLPDFRWESLPHNLSDATLETTGKCNATQAIVTREL